MRKRKINNIDKVAELVRVSRSTVSRVLNNRYDVSDETRKRVLEVIAEMNFVPDSAASALSSGKTLSSTVGILIPDLSGFWVSEILRGIGESAAGKDDLLLYTTGRNSTKQEALSRVLQGGSVAGVIIILPTGDDKELHKIMDENFPAVIVDHEGKQTTFPSVICENVRTSSLLTQHLLDLGHEKIGFIKGPREYGLAQERYLGFISAIYKSGFKINKDLIGEGDFTKDSGYRIAAEFLAKKLPITAIFAANDKMAFGAIKAVKDAGSRVPKDISVVGFGDIPAASYTDPSLTTVREPLSEMGHVAFRLLMDQIREHQIVARNIILPSSLIIRESCGPPCTLERKND